MKVVFRKTPMCEVCGRRPAVSFSYFGRAVDSRLRGWKFCCECTDGKEEYYVPIDEFFASPIATVDWLAHLSEKVWMDWDGFMDMMWRFREATGSYWAS